jgi:hypothetical protein
MSLSRILAIYKKSLVASFIVVLRSWRSILIQVPALFLFGLLGSIVGVFGFLGGLIMGLLSTLFVALYLALVRTAVREEKFSLEMIKEEGFQLFYPALSLFFSLFLVQLGMMLIPVPFFKMAVGILITVLLNPIVEFLYLDESGVPELIQDSVDFVGRHFIVWFLPVFILISPFVFKNPLVLPVLFSNDPLSVVRSFITMMGGVLTVPAFITAIIPVLYVSFFIMVFRGKLLLALRNK